MQDEVKDLVNTGMGDDFKQTAAELKRTATDLKSATDVKSAFRNDAPRSPAARPAAGDRHGPPRRGHPGHRRDRRHRPIRHDLEAAGPVEPTSSAE